MKHILKKVLMLFKSKGFWAGIRQFCKRIAAKLSFVPYIILEPFVQKKHLSALKSMTKDKTVYVIIPIIDWSLPLFQRPHQIAEVLSRQPDSFVLFMSEQYRYDHFCASKKVDENLHLISTRMAGYLNNTLADAQKIILIMYWTSRANLVDVIKHDRFIYEYVDEMELRYFYDENMENLHQKLMKRADLTVATANKLYDRAKIHAKKVVLCENGGAYDFFKNARSCAVNPLLSAHIKNYSCVLGYYGCLAHWFDYELIISTASKHPQWLFVAVGYDYDGSKKVLEDYRGGNILVIDAQPYASLPSFISGCDIMLIPFKINSITEATSPVKLFEYMAAGKAVLTSDLPECRKYESAHRYMNPADFVDKIEFLIANKNDPSYLELLDRDAKQNDWDARCRTILSSLT